MERIERHLELLADFAKTTQGRRKEIGFFAALHLGYLFAKVTGDLPSYSTRASLVDTADDVREYFTIEGSFVAFCRACGEAEISDRAIRDAIFEGQSSFDAVLIGAEPAPYLASGWVRRERRSETNPELSDF